jgi:hypothetical protein
MKKTITVIILLFLTLLCSAQVAVTTKSYRVCFMGEKNKSYSDCVYHETFNSSFTFSKSIEVFYHITEETTSLYFIDSVIYEDDKEIYYTTSDFGNNYLYIFDYLDEKLIYIYSVDGSYVIVIEMDEIIKE